MMACQPFRILLTEEERRFRQTFKEGLPRDGIMSRPLSCTVCSINIKHRLVTSRNEHVLLGVLLCNVCSHRVRSDVHKQNPNNRNWCQWCVKEDACTHLVVCNRCPRKFCRMCITKHSSGRHNVSWTRGGMVWTCFVCNPTQLWYNLRALCSEAVLYTEQMKRELEERRRRITSTLNRGHVPSVTLNLSSPVTSGRAPIASGYSNVATTVTVSTSPMAGGSLSVSVFHHTLSPRASLPVLPTQEASGSVSFPVNSAKDDFSCVICLDKEPRWALIPCGHLCLCETCFPKFLETFTTCPVCRHRFKRPLKIHGRN